MTRIQRDDFVNTLSQRGGYIDTRDATVVRSFRDAGITEEDLREIAGQDHVIRGSEEFGRLFNKIDQRADSDGRSSTIEIDRSGSLTRAGQLYESLRTHVDANRARAAREGGLRFNGVDQLDGVNAGTRILQQGSRGEGVTRVQQALVDMGYANPNLITSGTFDAETKRAVQRFQRDVGLNPDGRVGQETLGALASTAPPPGRVLETSPEYRQLYADGRLDVTMALGFDEHDTHLTTEREVLQGLRARGFTAYTHDQIRAMDDATRRRLRLTDADLDPNARYFIKDDGAGNNPDVVVRLITPSVGGRQARESFERAMQQDEVVIYGGHARYGTGPDFDHKTRSGEGNFVIDGRGNRSHDPPPAGLRATIGSSSRSDLRGLSQRPDYQLLIFNACSTEEYIPNLRNTSVFNRDMRNTDIIATTMPTRLGTNGTHVLGFFDGVMNRDSTRTMTERESRAEVDFLNRYGMRTEARQAHMTYSTSGFLGNSGNTTRRQP